MGEEKTEKIEEEEEPIYPLFAMFLNLNVGFLLLYWFNCVSVW